MYLAAHLALLRPIWASPAIFDVVHARGSEWIAIIGPSANLATQSALQVSSLCASPRRFHLPCRFSAARMGGWKTSNARLHKIHDWDVLKRLVIWSDAAGRTRSHTLLHHVLFAEMRARYSHIYDDLCILSARMHDFIHPFMFSKTMLPRPKGHSESHTRHSCRARNPSSQQLQHVLRLWGNYWVTWRWFL